MPSEIVYMQLKYVRDDILGCKAYSVKDFKGRVFEGIFEPESHLRQDRESQLEVQIVNLSEGLATVSIPHGEGFGLYGHGVDGYGFLTVEESALIHEDSMAA